MRVLFGTVIAGEMVALHAQYALRPCKVDLERSWRLQLARKDLWRRLTAVRPHSRAYALAAGVLAVGNGVDAFRRKSGPLISSYPGILILLAGQVFPDLPVFGMARVPRVNQRLALYTLPVTVLIFGVGPLVLGIFSILRRRHR